MSTKIQVQWRRAKALELISQGHTQRDIANIHVDESLISKDLACIRKEAAESLRTHIQETIPTEYFKAMASMNAILMMAWSIASKDTDDKTRLQALALTNDCTKARVDMSTNSVVITDAIKFVQQKTEQIDTLQKLNERIEALQEEDETTTNGVF